MLLLVSLSFLLFVVGFYAATLTDSYEDSGLVLNDLSHSVTGNLKVGQRQDLRKTAIKSIDKCDEETIFLLMEMKFDLFSSGVWNKMVKRDSFIGVMYLLKHFLVNKRERRRAFRDSIRYGAKSMEDYKHKIKPHSKQKQALLVKLACKKKQYWILHHLAKEEFNVNYIKKSEYDESQSILHDAVISGDLDLVKTLLRFKDLEVNCVDESGNTTLHYASNIKIYLILLERNADPFIKNKAGVNSLFLAHPSVTSRLKLFQIYFFTQGLESGLEDSDSFYLASREEISWFNNLENSDDEKRKWISLLIGRFIVPRSSEKKDGEEDEEKINEISIGAPFELKNEFYGISSSFTGPVEIYKFIGSVVAEALLIKIPIRFKFAPSIIKLLFGKALNFEDLKDDDPVMYNSMIKDLETEFEAASKGNPGNLNVIAVDFMYTRFKEQMEQFKIGFYSKISAETLAAFFTALEFQTKFFQSSEEIDRYKIYRKFEFCGNFQIENVEVFWAAMDVLTENELIKFEKMIVGHKINSLDETRTSRSLNLPISINNIENFVAIIRKLIKNVR